MIFLEFGAMEVSNSNFDGFIESGSSFLVGFYVWFVFRGFLMNSQGSNSSLQIVMYYWFQLVYGTIVVGLCVHGWRVCIHWVEGD